MSSNYNYLLLLKYIKRVLNNVFKCLTIKNGATNYMTNAINSNQLNHVYSSLFF